mmetsp:Transcript_65/g.168  ORF Transcript_65/g.168 Transcript_65/m.168 type:complete len:249 (+) Transcript_65:73-819(+)
MTDISEHKTGEKKKRKKKKKGKRKKTKQATEVHPETKETPSPAMSSAVAPISDLTSLKAELGTAGKPVESVKEWLARLGLSQYEEVFQSNAIQVIDLDQLTSEMLWQIGIKPLGHRLAMVRGAQLMKAQEKHQRRNFLLTPVFRDYCQCSCFAQTYKITATTLTVTKPNCCSVSFDPVDLTMLRDVNYNKGCIAGTVEITTDDETMPMITMKLENRKCEKIAQLLIQAKESDQLALGNDGGGSGASRS